MAPRLASASRRILGISWATVCLLAACGAPDAGPAIAGGATRVVSLSCAATDVFLLFDALDRLAAVEEDCPCRGTERTAKVRNEDHPGKMAAINVEAVMALRPDAVIAKPDLRVALENRGLRVLYTPAVLDMDAIPVLVRGVADLLGLPSERAEAVLARQRATEDRLRALTRDVPRTTVYYETTGLGWSAGSTSVAHAMIELAGGLNIAGAVDKPSVQLTAEAIFAADPQVIVLGAFADPPSVVRARAGWDRLQAVRTGRIYQIPVDQREVTLATPRCVEGCERMLLPWLHPELVAAEGTSSPSPGPR